MIGVGSKVKPKPPFDEALPNDFYVVEGVNENTGAWQIAGGVDFDEENLIEVIE